MLSLRQSKGFENAIHTVIKKNRIFHQKKFKAKTEIKMPKFKLKMFLATTYQAANVLYFTVLFLTCTQVFANQIYH